MAQHAAVTPARAAASLALLVCATAYETPARLVPISRLLLQRTVQTQTMYLSDFHDEAKGEWLAQYLDPKVPLDVVRISNQESLPRYHGLDAFPHVLPLEYLRSMRDATSSTRVGGQPTAALWRYAHASDARRGTAVE